MGSAVFSGNHRFENIRNLLRSSNKNGLVQAVEKLKITQGIEERDCCVETLIQGLTKEDCDSEEAAESLVDDVLYNQLREMLQDDRYNQTNVAQLVAELAKAESLREPFVEQNFVPLLLTLLETNDVAMATQACRALGNICYENDIGRNAVDSLDGVSELLELLKCQLTNEDKDADRLRVIACGFLLNLTNTHEIIQEKAVEIGALELLDQYLETHYIEDKLCNMVLHCVGSLADSEFGKEKVGQTNVAKTLVKVLLSEKGSGNQEAILELMATLAESDDVKDQLAATSLPDHMVRLIQSTNGLSDSSSQHKEKLASDLLVLLLTGDRSMDILYGKGEGPVFLESVKWLLSDSEHLQIAGALAVGNFARSDEHCVQLVSEGIVDKLITLLQQQNKKDSNITLQHAVLSALRNLAIPSVNKPNLVKMGVMDTVLSLTATDVSAVIFKLLGVLRMLVDGQEEAAKTLGTDKDFMNKLVDWCNVEEHAGVKGEATRLLAWLIKNSRSTDVMKMLVRAGGIPHLVTMVSSEHIVMQNEALVALTLMASTVLDACLVSLRECEAVETIGDVLKDKRTLPEILCNCLTLTKYICSNDSLREDALSAGILETAKHLALSEDTKVKDAATALVTVLEQPLVER
ncbi:rap1 GTPase-GDP dissociation stimulator 1-B-like isoform X1 [Liolophura sinensis]|uniref:rap1 GTPase-GDP dissociation stimulator 1-B-like isoform X1 n=1 Tax=Liolophura sinensis TaxID=3198878 RepID=UPI003158B54B